MRIAYSAEFDAYVAAREGGFEVSRETFEALSWCTARSHARIPCGSIPSDKMKAAILAFDAAIRGGTVEVKQSVPYDIGQALLLATARVLRAHLKDAVMPPFNEAHAAAEDLEALDAALKRFGPVDAEPVNQEKTFGQRLMEEHDQPDPVADLADEMKARREK